MNILVIPDVHGRTFWGEAVNKYKDKVDKIVFLGDFFDPYEKMNIDDVIANYESVIKLKKDKSDKVVILLGNHDLEYLIPNSVKSNRHDFPNGKKIFEALHKGREYSDIIHEEKINGNRYIFTHAGITQDWLKGQNLSSDINADEIRELFKKSPLKFTDVVSFWRGGQYPTGSPVWSDSNEKQMSDNMEGVVQITGHTLGSKPRSMGNIYCLDTAWAYIIKDDGSIYSFKDGEETETEFFEEHF